jgi:SAM-dependent methyltransferase
MPVRYRSGTIKKETFHTVSLLTPHLETGASVLDIGCGEGYVLDELRARGVPDVQGVDIVDIRRNKEYPFRLYDGQTLPFPDRSFDLVVLSFVLHHVPNDRKLVLIEEALRVSRAKVVIVEDTPSSAFDRLMNHRHGEPPQDRQHRGVRLADRRRMALAVPRHGPRAGGPPPVALLPVDPPAVRAHRVHPAEVARAGADPRLDLTTCRQRFNAAGARRSPGSSRR